MRADGTNPTRLTWNSGEDIGGAWSPDDRYPVWAPDGLRIAFTSDRDGDDEIYMMDATGTGVVRLTNTVGSDVLDSWRR